MEKTVAVRKKEACHQAGKFRCGKKLAFSLYVFPIS